ncbi:MAG TPA: homoserine dehydrogenase [Chloroflexota bacterium]|nr:homoserine dehydrogenase [Chloroflexota bacterium]
MTTTSSTHPNQTQAPRSSSSDGARPIHVGMLGLGVVGSGVATLLSQKAVALVREIGREVKLHRVLVRDLVRSRSVTLAQQCLTLDPAAVLDDPGVDIVVELMGGINPAREYVLRAISNGKHVVTANKDLMAKHGVDILQLAKERGVDVYYEASVGGGIPLIGVFRQDLAANEVHQVHAIINGTTNYILTRMAQDGVDFAPALAEAQSLGYAESNPTNDVEGIDASYKLAILASLAFRTQVAPEQIYCEGITRLRAADFQYARELGYVIKLLAIGRRHLTPQGEEIEVRVHPALISHDVLLADVNGVFNAVHVQGDLVGNVLFYGRGAGAEPTSSAVVADVIDIAHNLNVGVANRIPFHYAGRLPVRSMNQLITRYYIRLWVADQPGVLARIAQVFGDHQISIASCIQKETDLSASAAELVIVTHPAREADMGAALQKLEGLDVLRETANMIRIETVGSA